MNIELIRENINNMAGEKIYAKVNIGRNKYEEFKGTILKTYPSLFTIKVLGETKSFSYADLLTKNIVIKKDNT